MKRRRLTDLRGVIRGPRNTSSARAALKRYEEQNADLAPSLRRLMGLSALGKYYGRTVLENAVGEPLPALPFRDWSWRWWNALNLSGLGRLWEGFLTATVAGGARAGATYVRKHSSKGQYLLFLRRLGTNPHNHHSRVHGVVWTKGGCWHTNSNLTLLLVLKQHLPPRRYRRVWQTKLPASAITRLEKELMRLVNPDAMFSYEAKQLAVDYVRRRMAELRGWRKRLVGYEDVAWFFDERVAWPSGRVARVFHGRYPARSKMKEPNVLRAWSW